MRVTYSLSSMFWKWKQAYHWGLDVPGVGAAVEVVAGCNFALGWCEAVALDKLDFGEKLNFLVVFSLCLSGRSFSSALCCVVSVRVWDTHVKFCCSSSSPRRDSTSVCTHKISQASWSLFHFSLSIHFLFYNTNQTTGFINLGIHWMAAKLVFRGWPLVVK